MFKFLKIEEGWLGMKGRYLVWISLKKQILYLLLRISAHLFPTLILLLIFQIAGSLKLFDMS